MPSRISGSLFFGLSGRSAGYMAHFHLIAILKISKNLILRASAHGENISGQLMVISTEHTVFSGGFVLLLSAYRREPQINNFHDRFASYICGACVSMASSE